MRRFLLRLSAITVFVAPPCWLLVFVRQETGQLLPIDDLGGLIGRTINGEVDSEVLIWWCVLGLGVAWILGLVSLVRAFLDIRSGRVTHRRFARWLALVLFTGVFPAGINSVRADSVGELTDESIVMAELPTEKTERSSRGPEEIVAFGLGAGSALIGAGVAKRLRAAQSRRLRGSGEDDEVAAGEMIPEWPVWRSAEHLTDRMAAAVNSAANSDGSARVVQVVVRDDGDLLLEFDQVPKVVPPFERATNRISILPRNSEVSRLVDAEHSAPVLIPVGRTTGGSVWVNLEVVRRFSVDAVTSDGDMVWRAMTMGARMSSFAGRVAIIGSDVGQFVGAGRVAAPEHVGSLVEIASEFGPVVAILEDDEPVISGQVSMCLRRGALDSSEYGLLQRSDGWRLMPAGVEIDPVGISGDEVQRVRHLLGESERPLLVRTTAPISCPVSGHSALPEWTFLASVMGPPMVVHRTHGRVDFERSKAEELVIWLALHPHQRRRSLARTALWNAAVKDATFSNITAEVRRAMSIVEAAPDGSQWLGITMTDEMPLDGAVVADSELLKRALDHARSKPEEDGIGALRQALDLVRGTPFSGSDFIWPDYIGVSSDVAVMIVRASMLMAEMCRENGDLEGVYWATAKGLLALPGHEELVAIRMRAHADHGDFTGVRTEWDAYCRAIAADEWRPSEPAPKLVELWRQLGGRSASEELRDSEKK